MSAAVVLLSAAFAAGCPDNQVEVKAKTPLRRGPGLNYPVVGFVERPTCFRLDSSSMDGRFSLVEGPPGLGWVLTDRLDAAGQARARSIQPDGGPIGSGSVRGRFALTAPTVLRADPAPDARSRGPLPGGAPVVPLRRSSDRAWVELRTERGDVGWVLVSVLPPEAVDPLPVLDPPKPPAATAAAPEPELGLAFGRVGGRGEGVHLVAEAGAGLAVVAQALDTDAPSGLRRYALEANAPGVAVGVQLTDLGPLTVRGRFALAPLSGLTADGRADSVGGTAVAAGGRVGWPLAAGAVTVTPELGYRLDALGLDLAFPGDRVASLVSSDVHLGVLGGRAQWSPGPAWLLDGGVGLGMGGISSRPGTLGAGGLALGFDAAIALHRALTEGLSAGLRLRAGGWRGDFDGQATFDTAIGRATLSGWSAGAELVLGYAR